VRFQILGSVRVEVDGQELAITAGRDRVLLGVLLLHANQLMTSDQLIDAVWPSKPPQDARNQLQGCVSRLRKRFAAADRVDAEPGAVADLLTACAGLPLALAIVAARAATKPAFPLATIAEQVKAAGAGLEPWTGPDPASDLRAVFSWSYRALDSAAARLFRLLGLHPGPDFAAPAAASLAEIPVSLAHRLLAQLTDANLIVEHAPGRWTLHDLLRAYAAELAEATETEEACYAARRRLFDHYVQVTHAARLTLDAHLRPPHEIPTPQTGTEGIELHSREQAIAWLDAEQPVLLSTIHHPYASDETNEQSRSAQ
jgi:hypothetical protein